MSEIDEPPAKVLKIDHIDGVTRVTEVTQMPEQTEVSFDDPVILGEESGIIEGGADGPEHGQEEWLSEGILTDDDYNPGSQEEASERTDSQLGSSHDEDQQNGSIERLDTTADSGSNMADNEANVADLDENTGESESNMQIDASNVNEAHEPQTLTKEISDSDTVNNEAGLQSTDVDNEEHAMESQTYTEPQNDVDTDNTPSVSNVNSESKETKVELNIEETMKHLDGAKEEDSKNDVFDSLLIKKDDVKQESKNVKTETKREEDDGNDTDDLLRMLGEDGSKTKKKLSKTVKDIRAQVKKRDASSDDDDDFVFEGASVKKLKIAKNALAKKQQAVKAEPEDLDDGDDESDVSADEVSTMKKMFSAKSKPNVVTKGKPPPKNNSTPNVVVKRPPGANIVNVIKKPVNSQVAAKPQTNIRQYHNKRLITSVLKPTPSPTKTKAPTPAPTPTKTPAPTPKSVAAAKAPTRKALEAAREPFNNAFKPPEVQTPAPFKPALKPAARQPGPKPEPDEKAPDEEFLDEEQFDMDEDEFAESDAECGRRRRRGVRPELMDEEVPSDGESPSEDGSLYDELPSSDSEDLDDWFQLDIRAEKAGDYIPLLGSRARELLLEEKRRVGSRLQSLKQSLSALTDSGRKQAEQLREATMRLAELDDMLKAS